MPCSPNDVSIDIPDGPSGPAIPGFGPPFALKTPDISPYPDGFPEDLLDLLDRLQLLIPPGALKPALNPNFGKDVFDAIMKLLDQFMPFLMLYKFFLPILNLIICIIEVLCALMNPFKLIRALKRLFRTCIPEFLNLFPIFALICMIISLLLLLLELILYIISQILKFIEEILRNINALVKAAEDADGNSILAIAKKLGALLCIFQNLFVLLSLFAIIIQIIKDIISRLFAIPPCDDGDPSDEDNCCTPDVCPAIVKESPYTRFTGTFQYLNQVGVKTSLALPALFGGSFNFDVRSESWQLFDNDQEQAQKFINIIDAYDIPPNIFPKPIFFPTDAAYNATTSPKQAAYTVDLKVFYNPAQWGRPGTGQYVTFKDCIVQKAPTANLSIFDNTTKSVPNGVFFLVGGTGFDQNNAPLQGFASDGVTQIPFPATLENFFHKPGQFSADPVLLPGDGYTFFNAEYTFKPNLSVLLNKNLITLGCEPSLALNRAFINTVTVSNLGVKTKIVSDIFNLPDFPDPSATQQCLTLAIDNLRRNLTPAGVAEFQAMTDLCLGRLQKDTNNAIRKFISAGFDPCKSTFSLTPTTQFTSKPIIITVNLNDSNGITLTPKIDPEAVAKDTAANIKAHIDFGTVTPFTYDGYQSFTAELSSTKAGSGKVMISFENQTLCTNIIPADIDIDPSHVLQTIDYRFILTPFGPVVPIAPTGEGDTDGVLPRRDAGDVSRDGSGNPGSKDGS